MKIKKLWPNNNLKNNNKNFQINSRKKSKSLLPLIRWKNYKIRWNKWMNNLRKKMKIWNQYKLKTKGISKNKSVKRNKKKIIKLRLKNRWRCSKNNYKHPNRTWRTKRTWQNNNLRNNNRNCKSNSKKKNKNS